MIEDTLLTKIGNHNSTHRDTCISHSESYVSISALQAEEIHLDMLISSHADSCDVAVSLCNQEPPTLLSGLHHIQHGKNSKY
mmetsp:Transcript_88460/g.153543  ORF Transcript_88460/g.153543 Transcript_88460/m.153543 type:complete len:82 (+) Transcript_88460:287-532(+)